MLAFPALSATAFDAGYVVPDFEVALVATIRDVALAESGTAVDVLPTTSLVAAQHRQHFIADWRDFQRTRYARITGEAIEGMIYWRDRVPI